MTRDRLIICIASAWDYDPTSKHHVMKILARHNDVLWVNYHGTRRPRLNRIDARGSLSALARVARGVTRVAETMWQVTPFVIPGARRAFAQRTSNALLAYQIRRAIKKVARSPRRPVQLWSFAPDVPDLLGRFDEECSIYYCVDEFSEFEGVDGERIRHAEQQMLERAGVVVTTSQALLDARRPFRPDAALIRHGVDFDHFASAWRSQLPVPSDMRAIARPIFGFFGLIEHWIDIRLLEAVARSRPDYSFVLIGAQRIDVSVLRALPNVYLLGRRPYGELPAYAAAFDAALLPFTRTTMTRNVNPIKMLEYLAAGLRVVSTPLPEASRYPDEILIADTAEHFANACDALLHDAHAYPRYAIARAAAPETWTSRVQSLSELVIRHVEGVGAERTRAAKDVLLSQRRNDDRVPKLSGDMDTCVGTRA